MLVWRRVDKLTPTTSMEYCWDIAAAVVIVQEAGGVCITPTGEEEAVCTSMCVCEYVCERGSVSLTNMTYFHREVNSGLVHQHYCSPTCL